LYTSFQVARGGLPADLNVLDDGKDFTTKIKLWQSEWQSLSWSPERHVRGNTISVRLGK